MVDQEVTLDMLEGLNVGFATRLEYEAVGSSLGAHGWAHLTYKRSGHSGIVVGQTKDLGNGYRLLLLEALEIVGPEGSRAPISALPDDSIEELDAALSVVKDYMDAIDFQKAVEAECMPLIEG